MNGLFRMGRSLTVIAAFAVIAALACSESETMPAAQSPAQSPATTPAPGQPETKAQAPKTTPAEPAADASVSRGRAVYAANCIACHNPDPALDGGIGPAVAGSSLALVEARIMRSQYPEGYTPKRDTRAMIALPYLENDLAAIVAFLAE
jgi:mono/diheme cytochrome c family protein